MSIRVRRYDDGEAEVQYWWPKRPRAMNSDYYPIMYTDRHTRQSGRIILMNYQGVS